MHPRRSFFTVCIFSSTISLFYLMQLFGQGTWVQKANLPGSARFAAVGFSIGEKGYVGTGASWSTVFYQDFWEWDKATNTWTQKANFPGTARRGAVGFSIDTKGYVGTGTTGSGTFFSDFWEYDPLANSWTAKATFPGSPRSYAIGFSTGNKGYICTGENNTVELQDFWEYDPVTDSWSKKADFAGGARSYHCVAMSIGNKAYVGTGLSGGLGGGATLYKDFWEWNPATNIWTQKANLAGSARSEGVGFSITNYGFVGTGTLQQGIVCTPDFWRYDVMTNVWSPVTSFPGGMREFAVAFAIGCKGYVGTGFVNDKFSTVTNDLWELTPNPDPCNTISVTATSTDPPCNGQCSGTAVAVADSGFVQYTYSWSNGATTSSVTGLCAGLYSIIVTDSLGYSAFSNININEPTAISVSVNASGAACNGNTGTATITASGGTPSYSYFWNNGQTTKTATNLGSGTYICTVTDSKGCSTAQTTSLSVLAPLTLTTTASPYSMFQGDSSQITATGGTNYSWSPATGLSCTTCANPIATPDQTTTYCATASDINGCITSSCVTIEITCRNLFLPNAFSPNGDGENDTLFVYGDCIESIYLVIYNRWGEKVFETRDPKTGWTGKPENNLENSAVFPYYLFVRFTNGKSREQKGNISLVR